MCVRQNESNTEEEFIRRVAKVARSMGEIKAYDFETELLSQLATYMVLSPWMVNEQVNSVKYSEKGISFVSNRYGERTGRIP